VEQHDQQKKGEHSITTGKKMFRRVLSQAHRYQTNLNVTRNTTIVCVRKNGRVVMAGDGQVSQGSSVVKNNAKKVRRLKGNIIVGFAGSTADALTLLERLEKKLEEHPEQLMRACVELAKDWRGEKYLRHLEVFTLLISSDFLSYLVYSLRRP
jgi:ATP-dependent protease HslVU peptidase subunit